jgi:multiple sugar transport system substrate-binding protein
MIDQASKDGKAIEVQGAQYEGLTVWINSLIAGAGGQVVDQNGNAKIDDSAAKAAAIESKLANSKAAPPGMSTNKEDEARIGFESGRSNYQTNYTFIYPSAAAIKGFQEKIGWARYPRTEKDKESKPPLGGINIGVSSYTKNSDLAFDAAECLASDEHQAIAAELGGLPPTTEAVYNDPKVKKAFPFADLLRESIDAAAPRPVTPAYSDISLAIQKTFHPPDGVQADGIVKQLQDRMEKAGQGEIF